MQFSLNKIVFTPIERNSFHLIILWYALSELLNGFQVWNLAHAMQLQKSIELNHQKFSRISIISERNKAIFFYLERISFHGCTFIVLSWNRLRSISNNNYQHSSHEYLDQKLLFPKMHQNLREFQHRCCFKANVKLFVSKFS